MPAKEASRYKTVQALTQGLLEATAQQMERQGWVRMGDMALAKPTLDSRPPYWVQSMSRPPPAPVATGRELSLRSNRQLAEK